MPTFARSLAGDGLVCATTADAGVGVEVISTGTSNGAASPPSRPSRANRRHVNNWLVDNPLRRAVADTNREPS
jgi:hypothetical protein